MKIIARNQLADLITVLCRKGARPFTVAMRTVPKLNKKDRVSGETLGWGGVTKLSVVNGMLNFDYENSVNRQLGREDKAETFEVRANWFEHIADDPRPIVRHRKDHSKLYVQVKSEKPLFSRYEDENGTKIDRAALVNFLPVPALPQNQGTEKPILTFTVSFDSILAFTVDGETYAVADASEPALLAQIMAVETKAAEAAI